MRKNLRELNDFLTRFVDHVKEVKMKKLHGMGYKYGNTGKLKKDRGNLYFELEYQPRV